MLLFNNEKGIALIMALIMLVLVGGLTAAFMITNVFNLNQTASDLDRERAFYAAEAGINYVKAYVYDELKNRDIDEIIMEINAIDEQELDYNHDGIYKFKLEVENNTSPYRIKSTGWANKGSYNEKSVTLTIKYGSPYANGNGMPIEDLLDGLKEVDKSILLEGGYGNPDPASNVKNNLIKTDNITEHLETFSWNYWWDNENISGNDKIIIEEGDLGSQSRNDAIIKEGAIIIVKGDLYINNHSDIKNSLIIVNGNVITSPQSAFENNLMLIYGNSHTIKSSGGPGGDQGNPYNDWSFDLNNFPIEGLPELPENDNGINRFFNWQRTGD